MPRFSRALVNFGDLMPRKKKATATKIVEALTGINVDPLVEKGAIVFFARYQKNRARGKNPRASFKNALNDLSHAFLGFNALSSPLEHPPRRPFLGQKPKETEEEAVSRLKRELDDHIKRSAKP